MRLVESIMTKNPCFAAGKKITVKGLMLHSVGCSQPKTSAFINSWNKSGFGRACVHAFIDGTDGTVYQTLPWNHRGWRCGGTGNSTHIGVEMCEPACIKYTKGSSFTCSDVAESKAVVKRTYDSAVELFAMLCKLCKKYGLDPLVNGVIVSHSEGAKRGMASNHGDPEHLWKGLGLGYSMEGFRHDVKAAVNGGQSMSVGQSGAFLVRVDISDLNIRKGPGTDFGKVGRYTGKGNFTIVEVRIGKGAKDWWGSLSPEQDGLVWIIVRGCSMKPAGAERIRVGLSLP